VRLPSLAIAPRVRSWVLPPAVAVFLVIPSLVYAALDRSIWRWDDSSYGEVSVDLWATLRDKTRLWPDAMVHAFGFKPPLIAWIGEFFVPIGDAAGSVHAALLVSVVLAQAGTLLFLYLAARRLELGMPAVVAGVLLTAGAPLFVDMSHYYMVEQLQAFSVAWALFAMASARRWHPALTAVQLVAALAFGALVKISTPAYMAAPALLALGFALAKWRRRGSGGSWRTVQLGASAALAVLLAFGAAEWYHLNASAAYRFARFSTTSPIWGEKRGLISGFWYWLGRLGHTLFAPRFDIALVVLLLAGLAYVWSTRRTFRTGLDTYALLCGLAGLVAGLVDLGGLALARNDEDRFLLPAFPCLALVLAVILGALGSRLLAAGSIAVLAAQFGLVTDWSYSPPADAASYFRGGLPIGPPQSRSDFARELDRIVRLTCTNETAYKSNVVGVSYTWLNNNNLELLAHEKLGWTGRRCSYHVLALALDDTEAGLRTMRAVSPPFYIGVDFGNLRNPLPADLRAGTRLDDQFNSASAAVFRRILTSGRYEVVPGTRREGLIVLRARRT
jgi:hypothetical protein